MRHKIILTLTVLLLLAGPASASWLCFTSDNGKPALDYGCTVYAYSQTGTRILPSFMYAQCQQDGGGNGQGLSFRYTFPRDAAPSGNMSITGNSFIDWFGTSVSPDGGNIAWELHAYVVATGQSFDDANGVPAVLTTTDISVSSAQFDLQRTTFGAGTPYDNATVPVICNATSGSDCRYGELNLLLRRRDEGDVANPDSASGIVVAGFCIEYLSD